VVCDVNLAQPAVGRLHRADPGHRKLLRQPVLQGAERAFRSAAGLRRISRDVLDAELIERAAELRQHRLRHPSASFRRLEVVAAAVGVERAEQTMLRHHLPHPAQARCRALLIHQKG
jgi:hypothetical protein